VHLWPAHFPAGPALASLPAFDARAVAYPSDAALRDYLSWRQADCHINHQYNLCFWGLVKDLGLSHVEAQAALRGTDTAAKNEIMYARLGRNYNDEPAVLRKGSVCVRDRRARVEVSRGVEPRVVVRLRPFVDCLHVDIIGDAFWAARPHFLDHKT